MNPSTALAQVLVDELLRCGVRHVVLCPGSRNAPLAFALHDAAAAGRVALHVRIDERSAAFLALGLALRGGAPVPVVCTSGTAVANLHPAVLEADHAGVPLLALTADRPPELVGTGANQTVAQPGIFGGAVRAAPVLGVPQRCSGQQAHWRSTVDRAMAAARGALGGRPGPVHLDVPLREPLVPEPEPDWPEPLDGRRGGAAWTALPAPPSQPVAAVELDLSRRTVAVAGHGAPAAPDGIPLVAEPTTGCWPDALGAGPWLLGAPGLPRPEQVLVLGRPTLHRSVGRLLAGPDVAVTVVSEDPQWTDVAGSAVATGTALRTTGIPDRDWHRAWTTADATAAKAVASTLDGTSGLDVARQVVAAIPDGSLLMIGSSNPIRDVALAAVPRPGLTVLANRGVSGIDGTVATALGAALAHDAPCYALLGDLTFLHDANGLLLGPAEARPDLTIVVANDDGGGIFALLEQGEPEHGAAFERVFGTPHGTDLAALCAAHRVPHDSVTVEALAGALAPQPGLRVLEVRTARSGLRALHARIREAVSGSWSAAPR
ncbi:MAG: 2-succinyl-5-enolpyruvyl-6-hydroxy-3-cyclohexene-1-carboxylic-acid synthase [Pseudonocardiaceae bacterium]|nr:2-succinyl-5-enolpyruvyl-6-hydroxy-3-cyclohexene-1-carboxylic-acid synthase [Pseudonocardiaceae bacterium]